MKDLLNISIIPEAYYNFQSHKHSTWEFVYYIYGMGVIIVGDVEVPFEPGVIVCLPPDVLHSEHSEEGYRNIHFSVQVFDGLNSKIPHFKDNEGRDFYDIVMQLHNNYHIKPKNWRGLTESLLSTLYQYMISWECETKKHPLVEITEAMLISNLSNKDLCIDKVLEDIPLAEDYFRSIFKKQLGKTPLQYLTWKRIEYAKKLLETRDQQYIKISEVSSLVGIDDPYYFSRIFKKSTGLSPSAWIEKVNSSVP